MAALSDHAYDVSQNTTGIWNQKGGILCSANSPHTFHTFLFRQVLKRKLRSDRCAHLAHDARGKTRADVAIHLDAESDIGRNQTADSARAVGIFPERRISGRSRRSAANRSEREPSEDPLLFGRDVIHGYRTVFPIPLGQSATWNPDLIDAQPQWQHARRAPKGFIGHSRRCLISPAIHAGASRGDLGEDPYLTGQLGAAMIRSFRGRSLGEAGNTRGMRETFCGVRRRRGWSGLQFHVHSRESASRGLSAAIPRRHYRWCGDIHDRV